MKFKRRLQPHSLIYFLSFGGAIIGIFIFLTLFLKFSNNSIVYAYIGSFSLYVIFSLLLSWVQVVEVEDDRKEEKDKLKRQLGKWRIQ